MSADSEHFSTESSSLAGDLFERRVVLVSGELDTVASSELAARLMTLDAIGDDDVELRIGTCQGSLEATLAVLDVLDVLGVEVATIGFGTIEGGPVGLVASGARRALARHARLCLREPQVAASGTAGDLERSLAEHGARRQQFFATLSRRTRRPVDEVESDWARRTVLEADDAIALGYADRVLAPAARRSAGQTAPPPPSGVPGGDR
jgi:ATP-dependent Clp protease protease subunit